MSDTPETAAPEIPLDLINRKKAMKAIVTTHNLLSDGMFTRAAFEAVVECQGFLKNLHKEITNEILQHPDFDKDPELKILKEPQNGETKG